MNDKKIKLYKKRIRTILCILICIWLVIIFVFSQQDGDTSSGLSMKISKLIFKSDETAKSMEVYVRKVAHMLEYSIGGVLFTILFMTYNIDFWKRTIVVSAIVTGIAALDEFHQSFVPGRYGVWYDVLIDLGGCIIGIFVIHVIFILINTIDYLAVAQVDNIESEKETENPYKYNKD